MNQSCRVCGEVAAGYHFGAFTCEGCKSFFGRTYNNRSSIGECKNNDQCIINKKNRTSCKSCRLKKCVSVGMSKSSSRYGRRSNWFKIHCLLQDQGMMQQQQQQPPSQQPQPQSQHDHDPDVDHQHQQLQQQLQQLQQLQHQHQQHQHQQQQQQQQQTNSQSHHYLPDLPSTVQTPHQLNTPTSQTNLQDLHHQHLARFLQAGQDQQAAQSLGDAVAMALALGARTTTTSSATQSPADLSLHQQQAAPPPTIPTQTLPKLEPGYESAIAQMQSLYAYCFLVSQLNQQQTSAKGGT